MIEALSFSFIQQAIIATVLVSIASGIIGALVVVNRLVFLSGGIAHTAYGGIGVALFFGISPLLGAGFVAVVAALFIAYITYQNRHRSDSTIGVIWAIGMAIGVIFIDLTPGYNADIMSYLFGSILAVGWSDLVVIAVLDLLIIAVVFRYYHSFVALSFDEEFAMIKGIKVKLLYSVMLVLAALTIVISIRVVGLMLVIAMLAIPTQIAEKFAKNLAQMMMISAFLALVFSLVGLAISYSFDITSGAAIILVAGVVYLASLLKSN